MIATTPRMITVLLGRMARVNLPSVVMDLSGIRMEDRSNAGRRYRCEAVGVNNAELEDLQAAQIFCVATIRQPASMVHLVFVLIEAGTFTMGSPESELGRDNDETQHEVILTNDFYMSDHEVTQSEWEALIGNNPSGRNNGTCPTWRLKA